MSDTLYLKQLECGPMQNYVYLIGDPATRQAAVVDPAWEVERIVRTAQEDDYTITKVLITHTHQDHTGGQLFGNYIPGVVELLEQVDVPAEMTGQSGRGAHQVRDQAEQARVSTKQ